MSALPASLSAVAVLTLFAMVMLICAGQLSKNAGAITALGLLGAVLASLPAVAGPSGEILPILAVAGFAALAVLLLPSIELERPEQQLEVGALILLGSAGAIVLATADNLLSLALGLETLSLSAAIMTALGSGTRSVEAAFKYFLLAAMSLAALIYGIGLYALATGSLSLGAPPPADATMQLVYSAGLVLIALGFAFELAVAPLHFGALGAYIAAPPALAGYIMSVSKLAAALALSRLAVMLGAPVSAVLVGIGVFSIGWGTIAAFAQRDLRGLLGYSAIAHAGFVALALGSGSDGQTAARFYVLTYGATAMLVFASLSGQGNGPLPLDALGDIGRGPLQGDSISAPGLGPLRSIALALGLLSLAGIPPTPGFWAKLAILGPAWSVAGIGPTLVAVVGGVAGAMYYLRPLPDLFAGIRTASPRQAASVVAAVSLACAAVVLFGLAPGLIYPGR